MPGLAPYSALLLGVLVVGLAAGGSHCWSSATSSPAAAGTSSARPAGASAPKPRPPQPQGVPPVRPPVPRPSPTRASRPVPARPPRPADLPPRSAAAALPPDVHTGIPDEGVDRSADAVDGGDTALLEIQVGRLARRVLKAYWSGDDVLLPLAAWLDLAEVQHRDRGARIEGRQQPRGTGFVVDADSGLVRLGRDSRRPGDEDLRSIGGEVYASLDVISELFDLSAGIDRENAAVVFHNPEGLPIARRLQREAARSIRVGGDGQVSPELIHRGPDHSFPGVVMAYEVRGSSRPGSASSYDLGVATGIAGGSGVLRARGTTEAAPLLEGAWSRAWPHQRWLTQLRLGDGLMSGPRPDVSRGFSLTNAPINRAVLVEDLPFAGTLPPDWSVEAYRAGQLVGFDSVGVSGRYSLTLPVHYGENPVDFVAYGPFGEVRTFNRTFRALPSMVPARVWEYGVSAGECRTDRCEATANLDLRYGMSRRWTVRAGLDQLWGGGHGALFRPYAGVLGAPTNALGIELEAEANLMYRAGLRLEPSTRLRLTGDYVTYTDSGSPLVPPGTKDQWSLYGRLMPGRRIGAVVLEAQGTHTRTTSGDRTQARTGAALQLHSVVVRPYVRVERTPAAAGPVRRSYLGLGATVLPLRSLGPVLGGFWLQGQIEAEDTHRPTSAAVVVARNLGRWFRIEGGTRWEHTFPGPLFTFSVVSQLEAVRSTSLVTAPSGGGDTHLDQSVGGSMVWSSGAPVFSSEPSLDRAGVGGRVFVDLNGDHRWQLDEPPAPGTRLLVGNRWVTTDRDGRYQVWGVPPWEELLIAVDTTSLASPWWTPSHPASAVMPTPNLVRHVDVPLLIGGVVEGSLLLEGASSPPLDRPLPVLLVELESGARTIVESFSDGTFYRMGLAPGRYEATVEDAILERVGLRAEAIHFELSPSRSAADPGPTASGLRLILRPR